MNGKRLKGRDNKEESTPPSDMPSGAVISKDELTSEKLPSDHKTSESARVEGDGMEAHLETKKETKSKDDKTEEESNAKAV